MNNCHSTMHHRSHFAGCCTDAQSAHAHHHHGQNPGRCDCHGHGRNDQSSNCCSPGRGQMLKRYFSSPEEQKERLEKYIEQLEKELSGAKAELTRLG